MKLLITKVWKWWDIAILKWCCVLYGALAGAYFHELVLTHVWIVFILSLAFTIRPVIAYWKD